MKYIISVPLPRKATNQEQPSGCRDEAGAKSGAASFAGRALGDNYLKQVKKNGKQSVKSRVV